MARPTLTLALVLLALGSLAATPGAAAGAEPRPGAARIKLTGGLGAEGVRYVAPGQRLRVNGRVRPYVRGEVVTLHVLRGRTPTKRIRRRVRRGGRFQMRFRLGRPGRLRLVLKHPRTDRQAAFRVGPRRVRVVRWSAGEGADGVRVLLLQRGLRKLGFPAPAPATGAFDEATGRAVNAFRKTNDLGRSSHASPEVYSLLLRGRGAFKVRHPRAGRHVEFDWSRQVLVLAEGARVHRVYHSSSGAPATPTVFGRFEFYRKDPGTNAIGMVHSSYFIRGYAVHGYHSVPNHPASHGCLRIPIPDAWHVFNWIDLGDPIFVYR